MASACHGAYLQAAPQVKRLLNQAFSTAIYVDEDTVRADLAEPFRTLLSDDITTQAHAVRATCGGTDVLAGYLRELPRLRSSPDSSTLLDRLVEEGHAGTAVQEVIERTARSSKSRATSRPSPGASSPPQRLSRWPLRSESCARLSVHRCGP